MPVPKHELKPHARIAQKVFLPELKALQSDWRTGKISRSFYLRKIAEIRRTVREFR